MFSLFISWLPEVADAKLRMIQDENNQGVKTTLTGHGGEVSALKFAQLDQTTFVSGDAKGSAKLWKQGSSGSPSEPVSS